MKTADTAMFFDVTNGGDSSCDSDTVSANIQQTVVGEPEDHWVPNLTWSPPSSHSSRASLSSLDNASTTPSSPVSDDDMIDPLEWDNGNLMYLTSVLEPEELEAEALTFTPPLEVLEDLTYPFHLQLHNKERTLIATSNRGCLSPNLARRSLAHSMMSDHKAIDATIGRYNALWAVYSSDVPTLKSILRGMENMNTVTDDEWQDRTYQLCGIIDKDTIGECVDEECSIETRLEYYLLLKGKDGLEGSIRCVSHCLGMDSDEERAERAEMFWEAGSFLGKAFEEMLAEV